MKIKDDKITDEWLLSLIEFTFEKMKESVLKGEPVEPEIVFYAREGEKNCLCPVIGISNMFGSNDGKSRLRAALKMIWQQMSGAHPHLKLAAIVLGMDTWVETMPISESEEYLKTYRTGQLAGKPGMGEALTVQVSLADQEVVYQLEYVRDEKEIVFDTEVITLLNDPADKEKARLAFLWPL